ncbi:unnamed protein product [Allacma fusca]|uniref:Cyclic nucleotide-binding domain-containing protein n=1 Tax=Allacma fusca TaxID=39272 RepID=A0A8J2K8D2_9HEXA|nr:unnamed protein product [Allacma fusca]
MADKDPEPNAEDNPTENGAENVDDDEFISTTSSEDDEEAPNTRRKSLQEEFKFKLKTAFHGKSFDKYNPDPHLQRDKLRYRTIMRPIGIPRIFLYLEKVYFIMVWESFMSFTLLVMYLMTTYCAFFSYYDPFTWTFVIYLEVLFVFDVFLRLAVELWRDLAKMSCQVFIIQYTFWQFILDLIAMFPMTPVYIAIVGTNSFQLLNYLFLIRFNRFIRIIRARQLFAKLKIEKRGDERLINILKYLYDYILVTHFFACCAYALNKVFYIDWMLGRASKSVDNEATACWLYLRIYNALFEHVGVTPPEPIHLYLLSMDFIVAIFTTVGYGDLYPLYYSDTIMTVFVMVIGSIIIQGTLNNLVTESHLEHDIARFDLFFRLRGICKYMRSINAPPIYTDRIREYYTALWNYREGILEVNLGDIPITMQQELMYDICEEMLFKSPMFRDLDQAFLLAISRIVKIDLYIPDMILYKEGDYATDMYYLIQGELRVRSKFDPDFCALILRPGSIMDPSL